MNSTDLTSFRKSLQLMNFPGETLDQYARLYLHACRIDPDRVRNGVDIFRNPEYDAAWSLLNPQPGDRVLDIGSRETLWPTFLLEEGRCTVYATDLETQHLDTQKKFLRQLGRDNALGEQFHMQQQDARKLTFPRNYFDKASAISVIEHIPEEGDVDAVREMGRVVRTGGVVVFTSPFSPEFMESDVEYYGGYEKRYNPEEFQRRFAGIEGLQLEKTLYIEACGGGIDRFSESWYSNKLYEHLGAASPMISLCLFRLVEEPTPTCRGVIACLRVQ
jgi:SAM-dependent methyltransferase